MSDLKMSDVFNLPMNVDGYSVESTPYVPEFSTNEYISDIECDSGNDARHVAHAINSHDRLVEEIAQLKADKEELVGTLLTAISWLKIDGSFNGSPLEKQLVDIYAKHKEQQ